MKWALKSPRRMFLVGIRSSNLGYLSFDLDETTGDGGGS